MTEIDFELARAQLGGDHRGVDALCPRGLHHVIEHWRETRQPFDVHVGLVIGVIGRCIPGKLWQAFTQLAIEQVELQLEGHYRENAFAFQPRQHLRQHFPWLEYNWFIRVTGGDQHLAHGLFFPVDDLQGARHQAARRIRITVVEAVVADLEQSALGAEQYTVLRQFERAASSDLFEHVDRIALAIEMPRDVQGNQVDVTHLRVALTKRANFGNQICLHLHVPCFYQV
ncbi:hypothetical protein D3C73_764450 [compost metagenome]